MQRRRPRPLRADAEDRALDDGVDLPLSRAAVFRVRVQPRLVAAVAVVLSALVACSLWLEAAAAPKPLPPLHGVASPSFEQDIVRQSVQVRQPGAMFTEVLLVPRWHLLGDELDVLDNDGQLLFSERAPAFVFPRSKTYVLSDMVEEVDVGRAVLRRGCVAWLCAVWRPEGRTDIWDVSLHGPSPQRWQLTGHRGGWLSRLDGLTAVTRTEPPGGPRFVIPHRAFTHSRLVCAAREPARDGPGPPWNCVQRVAQLVAVRTPAHGVVWKLRLFHTPGGRPLLPRALALLIGAVLNLQCSARATLRARFSSDTLGVPHHSKQSLADFSMDRRLLHQLMGLGAPITSNRGNLFVDTSAPVGEDEIAKFSAADDPDVLPVTFGTTPLDRQRQGALQP